MTVLLGRTTAGTTADGIPSGDAAAWQFVAAASGSLARIFFQTKIANAGLTSVELGLYSHNGANNVPGTLLGSAMATGFTGTGVFSATLGSGVAVTSGTTYWLAIQPDGEQLDWQGTASPFYAEITAGALPATWPTSGGANWNSQAIIWAEDAPAAQGGPAAATVRAANAVTGRKTGTVAGSATAKITDAATGRKAVSGASFDTLVRLSTAATGSKAGTAATAAAVKLATAASGASSGPVLNDNFNRSDGLLHAGAGSTIWTDKTVDGNSANWAITSGTAHAGSSGAGHLTLVALPDSFEVTFTIATVADPGNYLAMYFAVQNPGTGGWAGYWWFLETIGWSFRKLGVGTIGTTGNQAVAVGDQVKVRRIFSTGEMSAYLKPASTGVWSAALAIATDTDYGSGPIAFEAAGTWAIDDLQGGSPGAPTASAAASASIVFTATAADQKSSSGGTGNLVRFSTAPSAVKRASISTTSLVRFATAANGSANPAPVASGSATALFRFATAAAGRKTGTATVANTLELTTAGVGFKNAVGAHEESSPSPPFVTQVVGANQLARFTAASTGFRQTFQGGPGAALVRLIAAVTGRKTAQGAAAGTVRAVPVGAGLKIGRGPTASSTSRMLTAATGIGQGAAAGPSSALVKLTPTSAGVKTGQAAAAAVTAAAAAGTGLKAGTAASAAVMRMLTQATGTGGNVRGGGSGVTVRFTGTGDGKKATAGAAVAGSRFLTPAAGTRATSGGALTAVRFTVTASGITGVIEPKQWPVSAAGYVLAGSGGYMDQDE